MSEEQLTKDDLRQFGLLLINEIRVMVEQTIPVEKKDNDLHPEWLKSSKVRILLDMSPGSLQNLRISGKIRFKKVMGAYYYNKADLEHLFTDK